MSMQGAAVALLLAAGAAAAMQSVAPAAVGAPREAPLRVADHRQLQQQDSTAFSGWFTGKATFYGGPQVCYLIGSACAPLCLMHGA